MKSELPHTTLDIRAIRIATGGFSYELGRRTRSAPPRSPADGSRAPTRSWVVCHPLQVMSPGGGAPTFRCQPSATPGGSVPEQPNILVIWGDDIGISNLS